MYYWHPWQLKKSKSWELFWSYQLDSTADLANLAKFWGKRAELAVLLSWLLQNDSQDFHFFDCPGCWIFILCEIHCYLCPHIFWVYHFSLRQCETIRIAYFKNCRVFNHDNKIFNWQSIGGTFTVNNLIISCSSWMWLLTLNWDYWTKRSFDQIDFCVPCLKTLT